MRREQEGIPDKQLRSVVSKGSFQTYNAGRAGAQPYRADSLPIRCDESPVLGVLIFRSAESVEAPAWVSPLTSDYTAYLPLSKRL